MPLSDRLYDVTILGQLRNAKERCDTYFIQAKKKTQKHCLDIHILSCTPMMSVKLATTPATFLATKTNFDQNGIHNQHDHENHEYDIGSALNLKLQGQIQGQRTGNRKWPIRYCPIFKILAPNVAREKFQSHIEDHFHQGQNSRSNSMPKNEEPQMAHQILSDFQNIGTKMQPAQRSRRTLMTIFVKVKFQGQIQGQRTGKHKLPMRYCSIFKILAPKCSPSKVLAAHRKPFSMSNFKVKFKIKGRGTANGPLDIVRF